MLHLEKHTGLGLLILLKYAQAGGSLEREDLQSIARWVEQVYTDGRGGPSIWDRRITTLVRDWITQSEQQDSSNLIEDLTAQLDVDHRRARNGEGLLIEKLVDVVGGPYAANRMGNQTIRALRQALLLPEESVGLLARLEEHEMFCAQCGTKFESGEACTVYRTATPRGAMETQFRCVRCCPPVRVACSVAGCGSKSRLHEKLSKFFHKGHNCEHHQGKGSAEAAPQVEALGNPNEGMDLLVDLENRHRDVVEARQLWPNARVGGVRVDAVPEPGQVVPIGGQGVMEDAPVEPGRLARAFGRVQIRPIRDEEGW